MTETKEQIEILKHISLTHRNELHQRKKYEYLVLISYLSFLVGIFYFFNKINLNQIELNKFISSGLILLIFIVLEMLIFRILKTYHNANHCNMKSAELAEDMLYRLLRNEELNLTEIQFLNLKQGREENIIMGKKYSPYNPYKCWVFGWQFLFTLLVISTLYLYSLIELFK
jgi:hypothetical protein